MENPKNFMELLFGTYRRQVLGLLLLRPDEAFYVRQLARLTAVPAGSLHRELRALSEAGLLEHERVGNQVRYRANRLCPIFPELAEMFRKSSGLADLLRDALAPLAERIATVFVFGSIASSSETSTSDIDLFVLGRATLAEVVGATSPLKGRLGRDINPVVMTPAEFRAQKARKDRFVSRVLREPKLFVIGTADELG
jgi:predicted nucleotidyltransferase